MNAGVWSMYSSRPGQTLTTFWIRPTATPVASSTSNVTWSLLPGGGGAATRVPAGIRASGGLSSSCIPGADGSGALDSVNTMGARAALAGISRTPRVSSRARPCLSGAWSTRSAIVRSNRPRIAGARSLAVGGGAFG